MCNVRQPRPRTEKGIDANRKTRKTRTTPVPHSQKLTLMCYKTLLHKILFYPFHHLLRRLEFIFKKVCQFRSFQKFHTMYICSRKPCCFMKKLYRKPCCQLFVAADLSCGNKKHKYHLLSYYLANKRSLHVRSQGLKIPRIIGEKQKSKNYPPLPL